MVVGCQWMTVSVGSGHYPKRAGSTNGQAPNVRERMDHTLPKHENWLRDSPDPRTSVHIESKPSIGLLLLLKQSLRKGARFIVRCCPLDVRIEGHFFGCAPLR